MKFRHLPTEVEAKQWIGDYNNYADIYAWGGEGSMVLNTVSSIITLTRRKLEVKPGYWIIKNSAGELYPCNPDIFKEGYEAIDDLSTPPDPEV